MFRKLLSAVGIGGATVDTRLETPVLQPGERFRVDVNLQGGEVRQAIDSLQLAVVTCVEIEAGDQELVGQHVVQHWTVAAGFALEPGERQTIPFEAVLHPETPVTEVACRDNRTRVWLQTGLAIDRAKDASDRDLLRVAPVPAVQAFLSAMRTCGFALQTADVEKGVLNAKTFRSRSGCCQEFGFRPMSLATACCSRWRCRSCPKSSAPTCCWRSTARPAATASARSRSSIARSTRRRWPGASARRSAADEGVTARA